MIPLPILLTLVALASLGGAVALTVLNHDSQEAWGAFTASVGVLVGQHLPGPGAP